MSNNFTQNIISIEIFNKGIGDFNSLNDDSSWIELAIIEDNRKQSRNIKNGNTSSNSNLLEVKKVFSAIYSEDLRGTNLRN